MDKGEISPPPGSREKPRVVFWLRLLSGGATLGGIFIVAGGGMPLFQFGDASQGGDFFDVTANLVAFIGIGVGGYIVTRALD